MPAPAVADILKEFHAPEGALISLVVSALILGSVFGIVLCRIISVLLVFRFFSGCAGAAPLAVGAGTIADVALPAWRGWALSAYSLTLLVGFVIGPVTGGFLD
ncbi:MFS multidrug transporter [Colletotrichum tofieldiae]|nr:MFS multidrug transporter [Colletotrichum tofieldiae]GKT81500.1 MFS multidrug transporter [Colletotrichum tofieldiae]GKT82185.1 MFS multidrug transporter [Colletotrichum tofieldiae]